MTTPHLDLMGAQADRAFKALGLNQTRMRYQGVILDPPPPVWHFGLQGTSEDTSVIQDTEPLHTYKSPIPVSTLVRSLAAHLDSVRAGLEEQYNQGLITYESWQEQLNAAVTLYDTAKALRPYSQWQISTDGTTWFDVYLKGEPEFEDQIRYRCTFVKQGI